MTQADRTTQHLPASFASINYFGVNSFKFTNQQGSSKYIRYQFISEAGDHFLTPEQFTQAGEEYLFEEIKKRITLGNIKIAL
jgi:catalase